MADNQEPLIQSFCDITGASPQAGRHFLEASGWDLQIATEQFFENDEEMEQAAPLVEGEDDDGDRDPYALLTESPPSGPGVTSSASSSKPTPKPKPGSGAKIRTLGDLNAKDSDDDEDENKRRDLFAGGEKSALAVQDPGVPSAGGDGGNLIQGILKRAAESARNHQLEESGAPQSRFSGSGHTLGSETAESITIPSPVAAAPRANITRTLTFWRDGFSVEDGPLMRYDDPANREILQAIEAGRAPLSLMNVEPGQPTDVNVFKRIDEDYVAPKRKFAAFEGQGQRLGAATPGESSTPVAAPTPPAAQPAVASQPVGPSVNVDPTAPATALQIRLGDGTRLVSRFNHTHTVADVYSFVNASSLGSRSRNYVLQTTFPNKELKDMEQTIKDAGLINAVVVQKWAS